MELRKKHTEQLAKLLLTYIFARKKTFWYFLCMKWVVIYIGTLLWAQTPLVHAELLSRDTADIYGSWKIDDYEFFITFILYLFSFLAVFALFVFTVRVFQKMNRSFSEMENENIKAKYTSGRENMKSPKIPHVLDTRKKK